MARREKRLWMGTFTVMFSGLFLLLHHWAAETEPCMAPTPDTALRFHRLIRDVPEAGQQVQDPHAFVAGMFQGPAPLERG